jgi:hypothetical protein
MGAPVTTGVVPIGGGEEILMSLSSSSPRARRSHLP